MGIVVLLAFAASIIVLFGTVALIYFAICWPISLLAQRLEGKLNASRAG